MKQKTKDPKLWTFIPLFFLTMLAVMMFTLSAPSHEGFSASFIRPHLRTSRMWWDNTTKNTDQNWNSLKRKILG